MAAGLDNQTLKDQIAVKPVTQEELLANEMLAGLAKEGYLNRLQGSDMPLRDASADMFVMAQGPQKVIYMSPELTTANRVSNSVLAKDPIRMTGAPSKQELTEVFVDKNKDAIDKLLWRITGNAQKANAWNDASKR